MEGTGEGGWGGGILTAVGLPNWESNFATFVGQICIANSSAFFLFIAVARLFLRLHLMPSSLAERGSNGDPKFGEISTDAFSAAS